jgi:RES domain-containing protein
LSPGSEPIYWRVGYHADPCGFVPGELYAWNYRFDDVERRFRSLYLGELAETCLREVLSDLRPKAAALRRFIDTFGAEAAGDVPAAPVTESWRQQHVLVRARLNLAGPMIDLCDADQLYEVEQHHVALLDEHELDHLDLSAVTSKQRLITQTIATDLHDRLGAAAIRFPSKHDGSPCVAVFEGRAQVEQTDDPAVLLTDPAPEALVNVCAGWRLALEPAAALSRSE